MSNFYCNFLSISPLFLYDTTINFWFPPLFYHDPSSSKQTMKHSFPMSLPKYSETTFPWIPPPTLFTHGVEPGIVLSLVEPPPPPPYIIHPGILPPRSSCCPVQHSTASGWACHGSRAQRPDRRVPPRTRRSGCRPTPSPDAPLPPLTLVQLWVSRSCLQNQGKAVYNIITLRSYRVLICLNLWFYLRVSRNCALKKIRKKAPKFNSLVLRVNRLFLIGVLFMGNNNNTLTSPSSVWQRVCLTHNHWPTQDLLEKDFDL